MLSKTLINIQVLKDVAKQLYIDGVLCEETMMCIDWDLKIYEHENNKR